MLKEQIILYLKESLSIEVQQFEDFGPVERIRVSLLLDGEEISYDYCDLPSEE